MFNVPGMADMLAKSDALALALPRFQFLNRSAAARDRDGTGTSDGSQRDNASLDSWQRDGIEFTRCQRTGWRCNRTGLGNVAGGNLAGRAGVPDGISGGAGISRGPSSLPRGEVGVGAVPGGTGLIDVPDTITTGAGLAGNETLEWTEQPGVGSHIARKVPAVVRFDSK